MSETSVRQMCVEQLLEDGASIGVAGRRGTVSSTWSLEVLRVKGSRPWDAGTVRTRVMTYF
jgi:hypothetical protein